MAKTKLKRQKVSMMLDESVIRIINERALREGKTMSDVIQEAVVKYTAKDEDKIKKQVEAIKRLFEKPGTLSRKEIDEILDEDYYDQ